MGVVKHFHNCSIEIVYIVLPMTYTFRYAYICDKVEIAHARSHLCAAV